MAMFPANAEQDKGYTAHEFTVSNLQLDYKYLKDSANNGLLYCNSGAVSCNLGRDISSKKISVTYVDNSAIVPCSFVKNGTNYIAVYMFNPSSITISGKIYVTVFD